jgi:hypothetical protein
MGLQSILATYESTTPKMVEGKGFEPLRPNTNEPMGLANPRFQPLSHPSLNFKRTYKKTPKSYLGSFMKNENIIKYEY